MENHWDLDINSEIHVEHQDIVSILICTAVKLRFMKDYDDSLHGSKVVLKMLAAAINTHVLTPCFLKICLLIMLC